jgi:tetratricopeptide (TPR) repeat protein
MVPIRELVVEIWAADAASSDAGQLGSGYLIGGGLVLTAAHLVADASPDACEARPIGGIWTQAEVIWSSRATDAAILWLPGDGDGRARTRFGRFVGGQRARIRAVGLPAAQRKVIAAREIRDIEEIAGEVAPLTGAKSGLLTIHVSGSVPKEDLPGRSPWSGMSGAAVFSGPLLVGVISQAPAHYGNDRLDAAAIGTIWSEKGFLEAISSTDGRAPRLEVAEDVALSHDALVDPYRPIGRFRPSSLLRPEYGVVGFRGRTNELQGLDRWRSEADELTVALVSGPGGSGKTRLGSELCERLRDEGWVTGLLRRRLSDDHLARLSMMSSPMLVVIDDAESRSAETAGLLVRIAEADRSAPTCVLLLAREVGDWWERLRLRLRECEAASVAVAETTQLSLTGLEMVGDDRRSAFLEAVRAFAGYVENDDADMAASDALEVLDLSDPLFDNALLLHMTALSALLAEGPLLSGPTLRDDLIATMLDREADYWLRTAGDAGLSIDHVVQQRAMAVATLTSARSEREASELLKAVPDLMSATEQERRRIVRWLRDLYPRDGDTQDEGPDPDGVASPQSWFSPLAPDILGEALISRVLPDVLDEAIDAPTVVDNLLAHTAGAHAVEVLTALNRAARDHPNAKQALHRCLQARFTSLWLPAIEVAQETGDPIASLLSDVLIDAPMPQEARKIVQEIPKRTMTLRGFAFVAASQACDGAWEALRAARDADLTKPPPVELIVEIANTLRDYSRRLVQVGQVELAREPIEEAVKMWRILRSDPGQHPRAGQLELAESLTAFARQLSRHSEHRQALTEIDEALELCSELIEDYPDSCWPSLAEALIVRSDIFSALNRSEEALEDIREAVDILEGLNSDYPGDFLPELADALRILARRLLDLDGDIDLASAGAAGMKSLEISAQLAKVNLVLYKPMYAMTLRLLSSLFAATEEYEHSLLLAERELDVWRELDSLEPQKLVHEVAGALTNVAQLLHHFKRDDEAQEMADEAVKILRGLIKHHPHLAEETVFALNIQAMVCQGNGDIKKAQAARKQAARLLGVSR